MLRWRWRRPREGAAELLLRYLQELAREHARVLARDQLARCERRLLQLVREPDVERAAGLTDVARVPGGGHRRGGAGYPLYERGDVGSDVVYRIPLGLRRGPPESAQRIRSEGR